MRDHGEDQMIYYVEDEKNIRELVEYALLANGFEIKCFAEGAALWQELRKDVRPELILLDIMLPGENGLEILHRLKGDARTKDIPVIMVTAKGSEYDKVLGLDSGADDYIAKPFGMMEMVSRVRAVLRRASKSSKEDKDIQMCGIKLIPNRHEVYVNEEKIDLTLKEYELLKLLISYPGIVFTREQLLNSIWGTEYDGETRTVDVHIRTLRQKLKDAENHISTIRGVGYRFEENIS